VLSVALDEDNLHAHQLVLHSGALPRLDILRLPLINIGKVDFVNALLKGQRFGASLKVSIAADEASRLLATLMRDAATYGPDLRAAHRRAGWYLVYEYMS
jgi:hypothetical protein